MIALAEIPYIGPFLAFATSRFGLPLIVAGGMVFYYEGVPIGPLRYIPYAGPVLAGFVDGRVDREYAAGQKAERTDWQERQRLAAIAAAADARVKQAAIDAAAQDLADHASANDIQIADLEDRIRQQKDEDNGPKAAGDTAGACKPGRGIPARLSIGIDAAGR